MSTTQPNADDQLHRLAASRIATRIIGSGGTYEPTVGETIILDCVIRGPQGDYAVSSIVSTPQIIAAAWDLVTA